MVNLLVEITNFHDFCYKYGPHDSCIVDVSDVSDASVRWDVHEEIIKLAMMIPFCKLLT